MSEGRVLEMHCGGKWVVIGRVDNVAFLDELADVDDKSIDAELEVMSRAFGIREEDSKKVLEMFEQMQIRSAPLMVHEERERPFIVDGAKRGKKGKRLKDWMR